MGGRRERGFSGRNGLACKCERTILRTCLLPCKPLHFVLGQMKLACPSYTPPTTPGARANTCPATWNPMQGTPSCNPWLDIVFVYQITEQKFGARVVFPVRIEAQYLPRAETFLGSDSFPCVIDGGEVPKNLQLNASELIDRIFHSPYMDVCDGSSTRRSLHGQQRPCEPDRCLEDIWPIGTVTLPN